MPVATQPGAFAARDEQHLGVRLQTDHAIDHLRADGFQRLGPVDVGLLVEARLQFHHRRHLLAAQHRLAQQLQQLGIGAGAVDGLLDGQHLGVVHRLAQEGQHAVETLERLVDQHVAPAQLRHDRAGPRQLGGPGRAPGRKQQRRIVDQLHELPHAYQIDRALHAVD